MKRLERVGCKDRIEYLKKFPWYPRYVQNIKNQWYSEHDDPHAIKVAKLRYLFGSEMIDSTFYWEDTPEGEMFWSKINSDDSYRFKKDNCKMKYLNTDHMVNW